MRLKLLCLLGAGVALAAAYALSAEKVDPVAKAAPGAKPVTYLYMDRPSGKLARWRKTKAVEPSAAPAEERTREAA